jgi:hypothetical protein
MVFRRRHQELGDDTPTMLRVETRGERNDDEQSQWVLASRIHL